MRQLVEARSPENSPDAGNSRVVFQLELGFPFFPGFRIGSEIFFQFHVGVLAHGTEFQAGEWVAILADAAMGKDHRALGIQFDQDGQEHEHGAQADDAAGGDEQVEDALHDPVVTAGHVVFQAHDQQALIEHGLHFHAV